jgi:hypothetical protein
LNGKKPDRVRVWTASGASSLARFMSSWAVSGELVRPNRSRSFWAAGVDDPTV